MRTETERVLSASVLVLNRSYIAVHLVYVRRALVLLYREIAEVIYLEDGHYANYSFETWCALSELRSEAKQSIDDWVRAVNFEIQVPRIVRLTEFDRIPRHGLGFNRRNLFARDNHRCQYCGRSFLPHQLSIDHVVPRSQGGDSTWENAVSSCVRCNTRKGCRTPKEAAMQLLANPKRPHYDPVMVTKLNNPRYESWRAFLPKDTALTDAS